MGESSSFASLGCDTSLPSRYADPVIRIMPEQRENSLFCVCLFEWFSFQDGNEMDIKAFKFKQNKILFTSANRMHNYCGTYVGLT